VGVFKLPYFPDRCITHKDVPPPNRHGFIGLSCFYRLPSTVATQIQIQHKNAYKWMAVSLRFISRQNSKSSTMAFHPEGLVVDLVGIEEPSRGRNCEVHDCCGLVLELDMVVRF
jgi:hypothetical protein